MLPRRSPAGRRCSSSTAATTARSTRRSSIARRRRARPLARRATSARGRPGATTTASSSSTTSTRVEAALADGDVACVLTEPALTNIGIVLPEPGFLDGAARGLHARRHAARSSTRRTRSAPGPAAAPRPGASSPTSSRSASRSPAASRSAPTASAPSVARADRGATQDADHEDTGGVGGTLAGNALSLAAARATLGEVLTDEAFARMIALRDRFVAGVEEALDRARRCPGRSSSSARAPSTASPRRPPRTGAESAAAGDAELDEYLHLVLLNRGVLITPFHNMALMCPATDAERRRPPHRGLRGRPWRHCSP